jgi:2-polyprenyl-3-methyl-5-hydroxy-6-metoxy-1,4-benzoquinol methylase
MTTISDQHQAEVKKGDRFQFGKNWQRFLGNLTIARIKLAENSLKTYLQVEHLNGKKFLDIGSGSGLFSLAARRLGATVYSFDYDTQSVACTLELRKRFFKDDLHWAVQQGSVLDRTYLQSLGTFDIVYSWGVLHHTGSMWQALENVKSIVAMNGQLFIAIYNDLGETTDQWAQVKRTYNSLPQVLAYFYALGIIGREECREISRHYRHGTLPDWLRTWTEYHLVSRRGMSRWHDWIDWIGGHPYERATVEQIVDLYAKDGFRLTKLFDCSSGYGCNEFVFRREARLGTFIDTPIPGGRSMARQFGYRVQPPIELSGDALTSTIPAGFRMAAGAPLLLIQDDTVIRTLTALPKRRVSLSLADIDLGELTSVPHHIVSCTVRPLEPPFAKERGHMWTKHLADLASLADREGDDRRSNVFVFEEDRQLKEPHSTHDSISMSGLGRFSHWGTSIRFSSSDNSDPNTNGRRYELLIPVSKLPKERSFAQSYGSPVLGPFEGSLHAWTAYLANAISETGELYLFCDDSLMGRVTPDSEGRFAVVPASESEAVLEDSQFRVVAADLRVLTPPFTHERGFMWSKPFPELADASDVSGNNRSRSFVFEDACQLPDPHAPHEQIVNEGAGRFSHWQSSVYLSSSDGTDPNANGRTYRLLTPRQ